MNMKPSMCAASGPEAQWEQVNWSQCELKGQETAGAYRQGSTGRPSWQGKSPAMAADPLDTKRISSIVQAGEERREGLREA
jgi:hypothetical protein